MQRNYLKHMMLAASFLVLTSTSGCLVIYRAPKAIEPVSARTQTPEAVSRSFATPAPVSVGPGNRTVFSDNSVAGPVPPFEGRTLANYLRHTFSGEGKDFDPDTDKDGTRLVFASTRNTERPDICLMRVGGTAITQITSDPADDIQPRFSPDGKQVVFASNRTGNWDIWLVDLERMRMTQLTRDRGDEIAPTWAPDGNSVGYSRWSAARGVWEIWTVSVAQPGLRRFLAYGMFPDWSPDGTKIAFQRARRRGSRWFSVWVIDIVDGEARQAREVAYSETVACITPRWSPDGRLLVYCGVQSQYDERTVGRSRDRSDIWVIEAEGGLRRKLTGGGAPVFNPCWSADGRVFFVSTQSGTENVWSLDARQELKDVAGLPIQGTQVSRAPGAEPPRTP